MSVNDNWMRRYTLKCGKKGKKGFEIGNIDSADSDALHINFNVEKSDSEASNTALIQIWNLSDNNLKTLESKDCIVELKAGYGEKMLLILVGSVTSAITTPDNADRLTEIEVVDGRVELRDSRIVISYNGPVNSKTVYQAIAKQMGVVMNFAKDLKHKKFPNGFSYSGKAKNVLTQLTKSCGHSWTMQNGNLMITTKGKAMSTRGYLLSKDTGLLGVPKRISIDSNNSDTNKTGYEVQYFLNGAIGINDTVKIVSDEVTGYFRVQKVTMEGDNLEGDWICTAQVLEVKATPTSDSKTK